MPCSSRVPCLPTQPPQWNTHSVPLASEDTTTFSQNQESPKTPASAHVSVTAVIFPGSSSGRENTNVSVAPDSKWSSRCSSAGNHACAMPSQWMPIVTFESVPAPILEPVVTSTR